MPQLKVIHYVALALMAVVLTATSLVGQLPALVPYLHTAIVVSASLLGTISLLAPTAMVGLPQVPPPPAPAAPVVKP